MSNIIAKHNATITAVNEDGTICVAIQTSQACGSCGAKKICGGEQEKTITLVNDNPNRKVGDVISVTISRSKSFLAITLAYLIPVVILVSMLLIFQSFGVNEMVSGSVTIGCVGIYFVILKLLNKYIEQQITINIE